MQQVMSSLFGQCIPCPGPFYMMFSNDGEIELNLAVE